MSRALRIAVFLVLAAAPASAWAGYGDTVTATPGLVAYWPLDEPAGSTITDVIGQRTATLGAVYGAGAGIDTGGTSVDFVGGAANFGSTLTLTGDRTIEVWAAERSTTVDRYLVSKGGVSSGYHLLVGLGGVPTFQVNAERVVGPALARGTWHHLVATLAGRVMTLYVDGRSVGSDTLPSDPVDSTQSFWIGRYARSPAGYWSGPMDEVSLYDRALDADTVAAHFEAGVDHLPPVSRFATTPSALTNSSVARFTFMGSKTGLAFSCRLDGGAWSLCVDGANYSGLTDGDHTLEVRATDRWGVVEASAPLFRWKVDLTPPRSFLLIAQPTATRPGTAVIGSEPGAVFECRSASGAWQPCPSSFELPDLGHSYGLYVRATDAAGNIESGESSTTVHTRPTGISFTGAAAEFSPGLLRGRSSWSCSVDGAPATTCPSPLTYTGLPYGTHTLQVSDPDVSDIVWPKLTWSDPLPRPLLAGAQFPALVSRNAKRLPRLLFQSNAPAQATLVLSRRGLALKRWSAPVARGSNAIRLTRSAWRLLRPGRYALGIQPVNAAGTGAPLAVRFDVVRATRR